MRRFVRALRRLIPADGAVLLLAHVDKLTARHRDTTEGYSGSTAWNNSCRARWYLATGEAALVLRSAKANHAAAGTEFRLRWDPTANMYVAVEASAGGGIVDVIRDRNEREGILAAMRACAQIEITVPAATTGAAHCIPGATCAGLLSPALRDDTRPIRRRFWDHIEKLRAKGEICEAPIRRSDRHYIDGLCSCQRACGHAGNDEIPPCPRYCRSPPCGHAGNARGGI